MGGVDLQDSLLGLYPIKIKSKKQYHGTFITYLMLWWSTVGYLTERSTNGTEKEAVPLLVFKRYQGTSTVNRKSGRPTSSTPEHSSKRRCLEDDVKKTS